MTGFDAFVMGRQTPRTVGTCGKCLRAGVPMATQRLCETCYGRQRPGRSGRTKDQNAKIRRYHNLVKALRDVEFTDERIGDFIRENLAEFFESVAEYLMQESASASTLLQNAFVVDAGENASTVDQSVNGSTVDMVRSASTADEYSWPEDVDKIRRASTVDPNASESTQNGFVPGNGVDATAAASMTAEPADEWV
jgi:hypothetical protein